MHNNWMAIIHNTVKLKRLVKHFHKSEGLATK